MRNSFLRGMFSHTRGSLLHCSQFILSIFSCVSGLNIALSSSPMASCSSSFEIHDTVCACVDTTWWQDVDVGDVLRGVLTCVRRHSVKVDVEYATLILNILCLDSIGKVNLPQKFRPVTISLFTLEFRTYRGTIALAVVAMRYSVLVREVCGPCCFIMACPDLVLNHKQEESSGPTSMAYALTVSPYLCFGSVCC